MNTNARYYTSGIGIFIELLKHLYSTQRWFSLVIAFKIFIIFLPIALVCSLILAPFRLMTRNSKVKRRTNLESQGSNIYPLW